MIWHTFVGYGILIAALLVLNMLVWLWHRGFGLKPDPDEGYRTGMDGWEEEQ